MQRRRDEPRRAGGGRSRRGRGVQGTTTASTSRSPSATRSISTTSLHGDLGQSSLTHEAVTHDLGQFIPATAELALYSILFASVVGIAFGVIAALRRNRPTDHALRVASLAGISMPTFWIALVALYVGFFRLGWFPGAERLDPGTRRRRT